MILGGLILRSIDSWLDRFCYKHPKLGIRNLMLYVVVGNIIVYLLNMLGPHDISSSLSASLAFAPGLIFQGEIWRLVTFIFVPMSSDPFSLVLSLYFYYWVGSTLEREWGSVKFTVFYGMGVLFNIVAGLILGIFSPASITADITYLNLSLFFAFGTLFPDLRILLFFLISVKVKWMAWIDAVFFVWAFLANLISLNWVGALLPVVAILNYILFFWSDIFSFFKYHLRRARHQNSRQTINFKETTRRAQQQKGYIHKCAVCGKTDTDHPDETFRYCSKCNGYYCYCSEHIGNHVHIE